MVGRVAFLVQRFPGYGGAEEYVFQLTRGLAERGIYCTVLTSDLDTRVVAGLPSLVQVVRFPVCFRIGEYAFWRGLFSKVLGLKADVIHLNTYGYFHTDLVSLLHDYKKFRVVLTSHGFHGLEGFLGHHNSVGTKGRIRFAFRPIYDFTLGLNEITSADALVALSRYDVEVFKWMGADQEKIREIPLGVREMFFEGGNAQVQAALREQLDGDPVILSVGELSSVKGKDIPLIALASLVKYYPFAKLVYIGKDGGIYPHLKKLICQLGLAKNVIFRGYVPSHDLVNYYAIADVLVHTSYAEGLSTVLLEAMAAGLPVISTPAGGNGQLLQKSQGGIVVPFNNPTSVYFAMKKILSDRSIAKILSSNGSSFILTNHRWTKLIKEYVNLYDELSA